MTKLKTFIYWLKTFLGFVLFLFIYLFFFKYFNFWFFPFLFYNYAQVIHEIGTSSGRLQNPTAGWLAVLSNSGHFFIVLNNDNWTEPDGTQPMVGFWSHPSPSDPNQHNQADCNTKNTWYKCV